ncbi:MAG: hypothetical protein H6657_08565 [Ardenticatenaceae bacterium]|nr:hypothetical protein [Ardenticatenaceae bacterium]
MNNSTEPINILLSREELLLTLRALQVASIPGIDRDPLGDLTPDGLELAMTIAERSLRARELAQVREDGSLALHNLLLTAVGVCAYATKMVFVYHWRDDGDLPVRYFGHMRDGDFVAHTRPDDVLHLFTLLPTKDQMIEQIAQLCGWEDRGRKNGLYSLDVPDFAQIRQLAKAGEVNTAVAHLQEHQANPAAATALVETLTHAPHVSILQLLKQEDNPSVTRRDFTVVQDQEHCWLMTSPSGNTTDPLLVKTAVKADLIALISDW